MDSVVCMEEYESSFFFEGKSFAAIDLVNKIIEEAARLLLGFKR